MELLMELTAYLTELGIPFMVMAEGDDDAMTVNITLHIANPLEEEEEEDSDDWDRWETESSSDDWDEYDADYEMGYDPYLGCYTDDC